MKDYFIEIPHFYSFVYHEGDKKMVVELDFRDRVLYLATSLLTKWEEPFEELEISYEKKIQMLHNIREYLLIRKPPEEVVIVEEQERE